MISTKTEQREPVGRENKGIGEEKVESAPTPVVETRQRAAPDSRRERPERSDGALHIRPLAPTDKERLHSMFSRLSQESIYRRFHTPYPAVPEWMISHLSDVDRRDTRSFIAVAGDEVVGHAMYVREAHDEAEFAIVVEDEWQSKGVGKLLLFRLAAHAGRGGIETFTATVLGENRRMIGLLEAVFAVVGYMVEDGVCQVRIPLSLLRPVSKLEVLDVADGARLEGEFIPPRPTERLAS